MHVSFECQILGYCHLLQVLTFTVVLLQEYGCLKLKIISLFVIIRKNTVGTSVGKSYFISQRLKEMCVEKCTHVTIYTNAVINVKQCVKHFKCFALINFIFTVRYVAFDKRATYIDESPYVEVAP